MCLRASVLPSNLCSPFRLFISTCGNDLHIWNLLLLLLLLLVLLLHVVILNANIIFVAHIFQAYLFSGSQKGCLFCCCCCCWRSWLWWLLRCLLEVWCLLHTVLVFINQPSFVLHCWDFVKNRDKAKKAQLKGVDFCCCCFLLEKWLTSKMMK